MRYWLILINLALASICFSQEFFVRGYGGFTYYQGDLAPLSIRYSFGKGHAAYGTMIGYKISNLYSTGLRFTRGHGFSQGS